MIFEQERQESMSVDIQNFPRSLIPIKGDAGKELFSSVLVGRQVGVLMGDVSVIQRHI